MELIHDEKLDIAVGLSGNSRVWKNKKLNWSQIVDKLSKPVVTNETYAQFMHASKDEQSKIKDVGGFVGGYLLGGRRKKEAVSYKQIIALDIDFSHENFWWDFTMLYSCAAVIHQPAQSEQIHHGA